MPHSDSEEFSRRIRLKKSFVQVRFRQRPGFEIERDVKPINRAPSLDRDRRRNPEAQLFAEKAVNEFQAEQAADSEANARAVQARAFLAQGNRGEAGETIGRALEIARRGKNRAPRVSVGIVSAQVRASFGKPASARESLKATLAEARKYGFIKNELEARLALGEIEIKSDQTSAGRARLEALEKDATAKGFILIANKAAALQSQEASAPSKRP